LIIFFCFLYSNTSLCENGTLTKTSKVQVVQGDLAKV